MGELRERRRLALPALVALGGMVVPIAIYLAINAGRTSIGGWGAAMSTDTALQTIADLAVPVDQERDHVRGPDQAPVTLVEYGDFECPYCGRAEPAVRELLADYGDLRYVWRHLPLTDVHPHALLAAEAAEAADRQGKFWEMRDQLLDHQGALTTKDITGYASGLGLNTGQFTADLSRHVGRRVWSRLRSRIRPGGRSARAR